MKAIPLISGVDFRPEDTLLREPPSSTKLSPANISSPGQDPIGRTFERGA